MGESLFQKPGTCKQNRFLSVEVMANVGPLAQGGLDESFDLAVGAGSIGTSKAVPDAELEASGTEVAVQVGAA